MKKIMSRLSFGIFSGTFIGLITSFVISWRVGYGRFYPGPPEFMAKFDTELEALGWSIILWSVVGIMFSVSSLIYENYHWSLLKQLLVHFIISYVSLLSLNVLLNWFTYSLGDLIQFTIIFVSIYFLIWTISMLQVKVKLDKINQKLNKRS